MNVNIIHSRSAVQRAIAATAALRSSTIIGLPVDDDFCSQLARASTTFAGECRFLEFIVEISPAAAGRAVKPSLHEMLRSGKFAEVRMQKDVVFNCAHGCTSLTFIFSASKASFICTATIESVVSITVQPGVFAWRSVMSAG